MTHCDSVLMYSVAYEKSLSVLTSSSSVAGLRHAVEQSVSWRIGNLMIYSRQPCDMPSLPLITLLLYL